MERNSIGSFENFLLIKDEKDQIKQVKIEVDFDPQMLEESDFDYQINKDFLTKTRNNMQKAIFYADKVNNSIFDFPTEMLRVFITSNTYILALKL